MVGVLAVELFQVGDRVLVNELAMRPHNSGHWTIEGARTSQFEQHLRAVLNLGHTFGHAIEAGMGYGEWLHGEAVAAGMVMAAQFSARIGMIATDDA